MVRSIDLSTTVLYTMVVAIRATSDRQFNSRGGGSQGGGRHGGMNDAPLTNKVGVDQWRHERWSSDEQDGSRSTILLTPTPVPYL